MSFMIHDGTYITDIWVLKIKTWHSVLECFYDYLNLLYDSEIFHVNLYFLASLWIKWAWLLISMSRILQLNRPLFTRDGRLFSLVLVLACGMSYWAKVPFGVIESSNELFANNYRVRSIPKWPLTGTAEKTQMWFLIMRQCDFSFSIALQ